MREIAEMALIPHDEGQISPFRFQKLDIVSQFAHLNAQLDRHAEQIEDLRIASARREEQIEGLEEQIESVRIHISRCQEEIDDQKESLQRLESRNDDFDREISLLRRDMGLLYCPVCMGTRELFLVFCRHLMCRTCIHATQNNVCPLGHGVDGYVRNPRTDSPPKSHCTYE